MHREHGDDHSHGHGSGWHSHAHDVPHAHGHDSHAHGHEHGQAHDHGHPPAPNHPHGPRRAVQWQTPHRAEPPDDHDRAPAEPDLDLVEKAFVEGFATASDPTSFLRLARIPFDAVTAEGVRVSLLRVETSEATDVGSVMPHFGGASFRYDPLPGAMVSRRRRLGFVYFDGRATVSMTLAQVRALAQT